MSIRTFARKLDREIVAALPRPDSLEAYGIKIKTDPAFRREHNRRVASFAVSKETT